MEFEFDPKKSEANRKKHGIDFEQAPALWDDPDRLMLPAQTKGEPRFMLTGKIDRTHWSAIFTLRENRIRIISVRRARKNEVNDYED